MPDIPCRLDKAEEHIETLRELADDLKTQTAANTQLLHEIKNDIGRKQAFAAGVAVTCGLIWTVATFAWDKLSGGQ